MSEPTAATATDQSAELAGHRRRPCAVQALASALQCPRRGARSGISSCPGVAAVPRERRREFRWNHAGSAGDRSRPALQRDRARRSPAAGVRTASRALSASRALAQRLSRSATASTHLLTRGITICVPGRRSAKIQVRVVLLEQPDRQLREALRDRPQRVAAAHDVDLGADDAMCREVARPAASGDTRAASARSPRATRARNRA